MKKKIQHNKKRSSILLYEFLIRYASRCLIERNKSEAQKTVNIIKQYFNRNGLLGKELFLSKSLVDNRIGSKELAIKLLNEVCEQASSLNARELDVQKSKLIKEINHNFNKKEIYGCKVPNYAVCASVQLLFNSVRNKEKKINILSRVKLEETIINNLTNLEQKDTIRESLKCDTKYNNAVYKLVLKKFNEKYSNVLNEEQKKVLTKYAVSLMSENKSVFNSEVQKQCKLIKERLKKVSDIEIIKDKELMKKINECYKKFVSVDFENNLTEEKIVELLQYVQLSEELIKRE